MSEPSRLHRAALAYVRMGWAVFPLVERGKKPRIPQTKAGANDGGFHLATLDPAQVDRWWSKWPNANIGVRTGETSGITVVDIDVPEAAEGKFADGEAVLAAWVAEHGDLPETPTQQTGLKDNDRRGRQFVFAHVSGIKNKAAHHPGIDTRNDGGYIVAPPSVHPSGVEYVWSLKPTATALAQMPDWLVALLRPKISERAAVTAPRPSFEDIPEKYVAAALDREYEAMAQAGPGTRNQALNTGAFNLGQLVGAGVLQQSEAERCVRAAAEANGWLQDEGAAAVEAVIRSGVAAGIAKPRVIPSRPEPPARRRPAAATTTQLRVVAQADPEPAPPVAEDHAWRDRLIQNADGGMKRQSFLNASLMVRNLLPGLFAVDQFSQTTVVTARPPWALNGWHSGLEVHDNDAAGLRLWLEDQGVSISERDCHSLINYVAAERHIHPVRDYLQGLQWDGAPRIDTWLEDYLDTSASAFHRAVAAKFMISAVARVMRPGCKVDTMLVLEGDQGLGKSQAFPALFGDDWTSTGSNLFDAHHKMVPLMSGSWCVEIAELAAVKGRAMEKVKALITIQEDKVMLNYARRATRHPRQCVFVGTVNPGADLGYWDDDSGARRLWPVPVSRVDVDGLRAARDQLWAEAVLRYRAGEQWWITDPDVLEEAKAIQAERIGSDPWMEMLLRETDMIARSSLTAAEVFDRLQIPATHRQKAGQMRVAECLKRLGYERVLRRIDGVPTRVWAKVDDLEA